MKKNTLFVLMLLMATIGSAQQLYLEAGKIISSFDYKNSQGNELDNLHSTVHSYMSIGYQNQLLAEKLYGTIGINYAGYGAIGSDDVVGNIMEWDVSYVGLSVGLSYDLFLIKKAAFYVNGAMSAAFLVRGTQRLNNQVFDLKNNEDFEGALINFSGGAGMSHPISENLSFYLQNIFGKSLNTSSGNEELKIKSNTISFGLLINISKK